MFFEYLDVFLGLIKFYIYKLFNFSKIKSMGIVKFSKTTNFCIKFKSKIIFGKKCRIRRNCSFYCYDGGIISIGNGTFFNEGCILSSRKCINIGNNCNIGNNVSIYDNDHDYKNNINNYKTSKISIGNNVWIGTGCIILRGVTIGNNCVIAAGSVINKDIPDNSLIYQKRENNTKALNLFENYKKEK